MIMVVSSRDCWIRRVVQNTGGELLAARISRIDAETPAVHEPLPRSD
jgi:hypothetical protein